MTTAVYQRTYSVLVENEPGVLARIAGLFSARGYNILSLTVGETRDPSMSRMTIVAEGTTVVLEQINKQLNKIIPVISVLSMSEDEMISEEHILIKLKPDDGIEAFVKSLSDQGQCLSVIHQAKDSAILRLVANRANERVVFKALKKFTIVEICRAGQVAISKTRNFNILMKEGA